MDVRLEPEQIDLLKQLVETHRSVPREARASFNVLNDTSGTHLLHRALRGWHIYCAHSDLEVLTLADLLHARTDLRGLITHVTVLPQAIAYYEAAMRRDAGLADADANDPLTEDEVRQVEQGVDRMRAYLAEAGVRAERMEAIDRKLDYLVGAARRCGRIDFRIIAVSVIWDIVLAAAFAPDRAKELLQLLVGGHQAYTMRPFRSHLQPTWSSSLRPIRARVIRPQDLLRGSRTGTDYSRGPSNRTILTQSPNVSDSCRGEAVRARRGGGSSAWASTLGSSLSSTTWPARKEPQAGERAMRGQGTSLHRGPSRS